MSSQRL